MGRKEREFEQRKREILEAALRLFSQKGYKATSMREIAKESEFAVGTLYSFFPNKRRLYEEIVLEKAREISKRVTSVFDEGLDPLATLKRLVEVKIATLHAYSDFIRLYYSVLWEARFGVKETLSEGVLALYEEYLAKLERVFAEGVDKGIFKDRSPRFYSLAFEGMMNALIQESIHQGFQFSSEEAIELFLGSVLTEDGS